MPTFIKDKTASRFFIIWFIVLLVVSCAGITLLYDKLNEIEEVEIQEEQMINSEWRTLGFATAADHSYHLRDLADQASGIYAEFKEKYADVASDEQKLRAAQLGALLNYPASVSQYDKDKAELEAINLVCKEALEKKQQEEALKAQLAASLGGGGVYYSGSGPNGVLTRSAGSIYFNGHRETWYSTREPGQMVTAYPIPGRYTGADGIIRDKDGYICVASRSHGKGTIIETSRGLGKVYDVCGTDAIDIYTEW